ncbi:hypothetical protein POZ26_14620 [Bacteroides uniformis]|uniref:Uncharacterized protein n=1 Tax=Bacteroides uniformis TaxID=820 RepID=A0AAW6GR48_BACUN|nr:hypothetical protein [Bacteroides uniformis]MDC1881505.1 hypothetical protein [Bacteroides uniformis]MDC1898229.1 hypothetical protein [Bacteroides uniformis]MDC1906535.1 hypothetical protein [Bacteroides uniformis]MDC1914522.1 hypothetical protein [Bacteroides uniformis]MDC1922029.1 hypothetical protein [Bacteroides uniformis]
MIPQKDSCPGRNTEQEVERNACLAGVPCQRLSSHLPQKQLHSMRTCQSAGMYSSTPPQLQSRSM